MKFDRHDGELSHGLEAAHAHARILHAGGDATGAGIAYALIERLRESAVDGARADDRGRPDRRGRRCVGVQLLDGEELRADAVVLATGGAGQLFPYTTNPEVATADGLGMALRAGAVAADLEFYQFHPTSLDAPGNFLVSEAVRGEGAVLIDADGKRFMLDVHPDAELAPRDVVARGIAAADGASSPACPYGSTRPRSGAEFLAKRFPNIDAACRAQGFDWGDGADPGHAGGALLHGRHPHRRVGPHLAARPVRRRRGRLQRPARRQPAGLQLAARGRRLRHAGHRGPRRPAPRRGASTPTGRAPIGARPRR